MRKLNLILNIIVLLFLTVTFSPIPVGEIKNPDQNLLSIIQQNRTVITCYDNNDGIWGGQGTITQVDQTGVWVTTAGHVAHDSTYCDVMFRDGSVHTAHLSKQFDKSDVAVLFVPKAYWPTHASIEPLRMGEKIYAFGAIIQAFQHGDFGEIIGFMFVFNDTLYDGLSLSRMPASMIRYPVAKGNLVLTNLYSHPGSSGGGVFDDKGNLVGLVSGGSMFNSYITYIVDVNQSFDEELKSHPEEGYYVRPSSR